MVLMAETEGFLLLSLAAPVVLTPRGEVAQKVVDVAGAKARQGVPEV